MKNIENKLINSINAMVKEYKRIERKKEIIHAQNCREFYDVYDNLTTEQREAQIAFIDSFPWQSWEDRLRELEQGIRRERIQLADVQFQSYGFVAL